MIISSVDRLEKVINAVLEADETEGSASIEEVTKQIHTALGDVFDQGVTAIVHLHTLALGEKDEKISEAEESRDELVEDFNSLLDVIRRQHEELHPVPGWEFCDEQICKAATSIRISDDLMVRGNG